jgi:ribonuclease BN (tRNA processing enzyme)
MNFIISPLGTRGWMPLDNRQTTSFFVKYKNTNILLDCGTGIARFLQPEIKSLLNGDSLHIIFSHYHLDHIIGLTYLSGIFEKDYNIKLYGPSNKIIDEGLKYSCQFVTSAPIFGTSISKSILDIEFNEIDDYKFKINGIDITLIKQEHKGGSVGIKIDDQICFLTDTKPNENFIEFAKNVNILIHESSSLDFNEKSLYHSNLIDAFHVAKNAKNKVLIPTHFNHLAKETDIQNLKKIQSSEFTLIMPDEGEKYFFEY